MAPGRLAVMAFVVLLAASNLCGPAGGKTYSTSVFWDGSASAELSFPPGGGWNNSTFLSIPRSAEVRTAGVDLTPLAGEELGTLEANATVLANTAAMEGLQVNEGAMTLEDEGWWWSRELGTCSTDIGLEGTRMDGDGARLAGAAVGLWSPDAPAPVARFDSSAVWDGQDGQMIVLGGWSWVTRLNYDVDFYSPENGSWTQKPAGIPQRSDHTAVWDQLRSRMLVFGGYLSNNSLVDELWAYYPHNNSWVREPSGPSARAGHSAVIGSGMMLVYGGYQSGKTLDELWSFGLENDSWSYLGNGTAPALANHSAVFDSAKDNMILFGGLTADGTVSREMWIYESDTSSWHSQPGAPLAGRQMHTAVWDDLNRQMLVFGGLNGNTSAGAAMDDMWAFDASSGNWTRLMSGASPRSRHSAVWDPSGRQMLLAGGWAQFYNGSDCWSYRMLYRSAGIVQSFSIMLGEDRNATLWLDATTPPCTVCSVDVVSTTPNPVVIAKAMRSGDRIIIPPAFSSVRLKARLETSDANLSPVLHGWGLGTVVAGPFEGAGTLNGTSGQRSLGLLPQQRESWTLLAKGPSARFGHSAVWDPDNGQMLVFGGNVGPANGTYSGELWAYLPAENSWYRKSNGPGGRMYHSACWDSDDHLMLVFGGFNGGRQSELWAYSPMLDRWTLLGYAPSARERHCACWDPDEHVMLVFGGITGIGAGQYSKDLLEYRPADGKWTYKTTVNNGRNSASAVWDCALHRMLVFGGNGAGGLLMSDLWSYFPSNDSWQSIETPVGARSAHSAAYNLSSEEMLVFGGNDSSPTSELWAYSCRDLGWTVKMDGPAAVEYASLVVDARTGRLLVLGGTGASVRDELWSYSLSEKDWTQKSDAPMAAYGYSAVWDSQDSLMLVYGGSPMNGRSDLWTYSPSEGFWSPRNATGPQPRYFHCAAWDGARARMLMFGGSDGIKCLDDLWAYYPSVNRWIQLRGGPQARMGAVAVWNSYKDELMLLGGQTADALNGTLCDVWVYLAGYDQWVRKADAPAGRAWPAAAWDEARQRLFVFGGSSLSAGNETVHDDLWGYSWADNRWTMLGRGGTPRKGACAAWDRVAGRLLLFGGENAQGCQDGIWSYSPSERSWRWRPGGPEARSLGSAIWEPAGAQLLVFGGRDETVVRQDLWSFGPVYTTSGSFVSRACDLGGPASLGPVSWTADLPSRTAVNISLRSSPDGIAWGPWKRLVQNESRTASPGDRFVQWRADLSSPQNTSTPVLERLFLNYTRFVPRGWFMLEGVIAPGPLRRVAPRLDRASDGGGLAVSISVDSGILWTAVAQNGSLPVTVQTDRFSMMVVFGRSAEGASPELWGLAVDYCYESFPEDMELRIGNASIALGDLGQCTRISLDRPLNRFLSGSPRGPPDNLLVQLCFFSATAARLTLSGLQVSYEHNRPPHAELLGPADGASVHNTSVCLSWEAGDDDGDPLSFLVFLSASPLNDNQPPAVVTNSTSCELSGLSFNTAYQWTVVPNDGTVNGTTPQPRTFSTVNRRPRITSLPPAADAAAGRELVHCVTAEDDDFDYLGFRLEAGPHGMAIDSSTGVLRWTPEGGQEGTNPVVIAVFDGMGEEASQQFSINVVRTVAPFCRITAPEDGATAGRQLQVTGTAGPAGGRIVLVQLRLDGAQWQNVSGIEEWSCTLDTGGLEPGTHTIEARAFDGVLYSDAAAVQILVEIPARASAVSYLWVLPLLVLLTGCGLAAAVYIRGRGKPARHGKDAERPVLRAGATAMSAISARKSGNGPGPKGAGAPPAESSAPVMVPQRDVFLVEDMFLMYKDGRLIQHNTRRLKADLDLEVMTSMLRAVQIFVRESLGMGDSSELGGMEYGENKILLQKGKHVILAVVISGDAPSDFREEMKGIINDIEGEYESILSEWNGITADLAGAKKFLNRLGFQRTWQSPVISPKAVVAISSELEFYQGFVRVKVAVKNSMPTVIRSSALKMLFNETVLRLDRIEPEYPMDGREIVLGDIEPHEKRTVALLLDPQICTESYLEGLFVFKDAQGQLEAVKMPRKLISVVCPIMYTEHNINVAMLKRMVMDELDKKDAKVFSLPARISPEDAFQIGKAAVEHHDMKLVRELVNREPYLAEAWYFGVVKGREDKEKLVARVRVLGDKGVLEFHVACGSTLMLTGMLAELKTDLNRELEEKKRDSMKQVISPEEVSAVSQIRSLLDKMAESENSAGETEQGSHELLKP
jgi:N-acetylneuraminic acid mutarotase